MIERAGPDVLPAADPDAIAAAAGALWATGIVGLPTETVYGLCALPSPEALEALLRAKRRPTEKGMAILVDSLDQVRTLADLSGPALTLAARFWPGPLTLVLPPLPGASLPGPLYGPSGQLAFRLPDHPVPRALAALIGPLCLTSANLSGQPEAHTAQELVETMGDALALVIDGGRATGGVPSTVVSIEDGVPLILREGALLAAAIEDALANVS